MASAKDLVVTPLDGKTATRFIRAVHYSGTHARNSQLHFGVYYRGRLEGAMQFGPPLDKRKAQGLVAETRWNEFFELNRMAFTETLPRNSESRALGVVFRLLRKHAPHIRWILCYADATQCGDGTIYRATGFVLTGIKRNENLARRPDGSVVHKMTYESSPVSTGYVAVNNGKNNWPHFVAEKGWQILHGFQLRYIYFLDPSYREKLTVPELPYSAIDEMGARMARGVPL